LIFKFFKEPSHLIHCNMACLLLSPTKYYCESQCQCLEW